MRATAIALGCIVLLAGCSDKPSGVDDGDGLKPTADTGILRGVVVDSAIRPIADAAVLVRCADVQEERRTDKDGAFGLDGLPPGTCFVDVTKIGYFSARQSVDVVAGVAEPPTLRIILEVDVEGIPYVQDQTFEGFIECTSSVAVVCGAPNLLEPFFCEFFGVCYGNLTNDRYTPTLYYEPGALLIQTEMVWTSTQSLSPALTLEMEALDAGCTYSDSLSESLVAQEDGESPVVVRVNETAILEHAIGGPDCGIYHSVFSGGVVEDPSGNDLPMPGVTIQQDFRLFVHEFHGYLPPEDWQFSTQGPPPPPPS